jgi:hypothetical protein
MAFSALGDELFEEEGRRSSDYLNFRQLDPMYAP